MSQIRTNGLVDADLYDLHTLKYVKNWVILSTLLLAPAIAVGVAALVEPKFLKIKPTTNDSTVSNLNKERIFGYTKVCFPTDNVCEDRAKSSYTDTFYPYMNNLRLGQYGMHAAGIALMCACLLFAIILLIIWFKRGPDSKFIRTLRVVLGSLIMVSGFSLQTAVIIFHLEQMEDKYGSSSALPYGFNQWTVAQRTTTSITYGISYVLLWISILITFISSWIMLFSTCCWSLEYQVSDETDVTVQQLPRLATSSTGLDGSRMSVVLKDEY